MMRSTSTLLSVALLGLLLQASSLAAQSDTSSTKAKAADALKSAKTSLPEARTVPVYANGSFLSHWHDGSKGCMRCSWSDTEQRRNGSTASLTASVAAWGSLQFASVAESYSKSSVLDFWARGSGVTAISLHLKDSKSNTLTSDVRFHRADQIDDQTVTVLSSDNDGWLHFQINLAKLNASGTSTGQTCNSGTFDRIIFADVSGMGFNLQLDDVKLLFSSELLANFAASAFTFPSTNKAASMLPVFGQDLTALKSAPNRYIMKVKDTAAMADVKLICFELTGMLSGNIGRRFAGVCNTPLSVLGNPSVGSSRVGWKFVTVTVNSQADLAAMRKHLGAQVDYFEADLTAYSTIRELRVVSDKTNTAGTAARPNWAVPVDEAETSNTAKGTYRPAWAEPLTDSAPVVVPSGTTNAAVNAAEGSANQSGNTIVIPAVGLNDTASVNVTAGAVNGTGGLDTTGSINVTAGAVNGTGDLVAVIQPYVVEGADVQGTVDPSPSPSPSPVSTLPSPSPLPKDETAWIQPVVEDDSNGSVGAVEQTATTQAVSSWGLDRINQYSLPLDGYYSSGDYDGRGVHIYVLDTGARVSHYNFRGRVGDGASTLGSTVDDDNGHGTHAAATALGAIHGVARSAIFHPVKVLGADGSGSYSSIIAGMQWVKDHKARNGIASAIISMSLAGPRAASLNDAVEAMAAAGITVVTAAGNNRGADACTMSPCSAASAITVGASTDQDAMSSFSNIGACLSLFAPGSSIMSASRSSDTAEVAMSGTSMAAPHVAGVAALYLQYRPGASPAEVKAALKGAAAGVYFDGSSPQRLLNAQSSRLRAAGPQAPKPSPSPSPKPVAVPSPSPKPTTTTPTTTPTTSFPSLFTRPSWCSGCTNCLLFCS